MIITLNYEAIKLNVQDKQKKIFYLYAGAQNGVTKETAAMDNLISFLVLRARRSHY